MITNTTQEQAEELPATASSLTKSHDFAHANCRWGWNIIYRSKQSDGSLMVLGVGAGVRRGHFVTLTATDGKDYELPVIAAEYKTNPPDMFSAILDMTNAKPRSANDPEPPDEIRSGEDVWKSQGWRHTATIDPACWSSAMPHNLTH